MGEKPQKKTTSGVEKQPGFADSVSQEKPHYHGHRQRLRERFMTDEGESFPDYELLELLLFYSIPRVDVKPLAKNLIAHFGSLGGVLNASPQQLEEIDRVKPNTSILLQAVRNAGLRIGREEIMEKPVLSSWDALLDYCRSAMGYNQTEQFRILFLNRKNVLIGDELQQKGTVDHTPVYPREVIKRALDLNATALIMVHNHPSGDPTPSQADIAITKEIAETGERLGINLHDHIIVTKSKTFSFKRERLL
ncbi:MAG: DNA repair protein RadC [Rhodospirillales bacterium]|nr:DNA repair protein RadC [Rhodospirillales bacterium]